MAGVQYRLGIDFGTSNTVAVMYEESGRTRPVLFDGVPLLPSSVCAAPEGMLVGREALHAARVHPALFEPHPKRRIDDGDVLLGDTEYPVAALIAAVLSRVVAEARQAMGAPPTAVTLTHPAAWAARRRNVLVNAAELAGLGVPDLVAEPVAAASYFTAVRDLDAPIGAHVLVYDFGAGTFDASVVRRTAEGWEITASEGLPDTGGLDIDAAVVGYLGATFGQSHPDEIRRLEQPATPGDLRAHRLLWEDVRSAKEVLSRASSTYLHLPLLEQDAPLGREQLERLARPVLERTVALTRNLLAGAVPDGSSVHAVLLVGGSSRIPLVATLLHRTLKVAPTAIEQPEVVVAEGSVRPTPAATPASSVLPPRPAAVLSPSTAVPPPSATVPPPPAQVPPPSATALRPPAAIEPPEVGRPRPAERPKPASRPAATAGRRVGTVALQLGALAILVTPLLILLKWEDGIVPLYPGLWITGVAGLLAIIVGVVARSAKPGVETVSGWFVTAGTWLGVIALGADVVGLFLPGTGG